MGKNLMDGRGPKTIRVPEAHRKVLNLTHNERDSAPEEVGSDASDMSVSPRNASLASVARNEREAEEREGSVERI
ncbi:hypothetical protein G6F56_013369 [Rhizopus delemar]|nr:hypothetical protein G6F56_013369 [Rhizopus delemar]